VVSQRRLFLHHLTFWPPVFPSGPFSFFTGLPPLPFLWAFLHVRNFRHRPPIPPFVVCNNSFLVGFSSFPVQLRLSSGFSYARKRLGWLSSPYPTAYCRQVVCFFFGGGGVFFFFFFCFFFFVFFFCFSWVWCRFFVVVFVVCVWCRLRRPEVREFSLSVPRFSTRPVFLRSPPVHPPVTF